jgi:hypothetical protein
MFGPFWFARHTARMLRGSRRRSRPAPSRPMSNAEEWVMLYLAGPAALVVGGIWIISPPGSLIYVHGTRGVKEFVIFTWLALAVLWLCLVVARHDRKNPPPEPYVPPLLPPRPPKPQPPKPPTPPQPQAHWSDRR